MSSNDLPLVAVLDPLPLDNKIEAKVLDGIAKLETFDTMSGDFDDRVCLWCGLIHLQYSKQCC